MKLPKPRGRLLPRGRGNVKELTMIVEERGIGFWTRVRLPSSPSPKRAHIYAGNGADVRFFYNRLVKGKLYASESKSIF